jgi:hypothetical protein
MRDPYASLEVPRSATAVDIKKSYRRLAKRLHPDTNNNDPVAATLFAQLKAAHEILGDEAKRRAFDRGEIDAEGKPTPEAVSNFSGLTLSMTGLMVAVATLVASLLIMRNVLPLIDPNSKSAGEAGFLSRVSANEERAPAAQAERRDARVWSDSRLLFPQSVSYVAADTIRLGIQVVGETDGLAVEISSLPAGMTISAGRPQGGGRWRILATDVDNAMIYLPPGFSGAIDLAVELRLFDDTVVDRGSLRLEWLQTATIESAPATAVSKSSDDKALASAALTDQNAIQHATDAVAVSQKSADKALASAALTDQNAIQHAADAVAVSDKALASAASTDQNAIQHAADAVAVSQKSADKASASAAPTDQNAIQHATDAVAVSLKSADKASAATAPADQNAMPHATDSQQDHESIQLLIGRSEKLLSEGQVEAARLVLLPAAEAHDARAALALGATYDPTMLATLQVHGVASDVSMAVDWYKKAQDFGSPEARQRLKSLTAALVEPKKRVVHPPIHVVVSHIVAPRAAAPPRDPGAVSGAGDRVAAIPDPSIHGQLARDDGRKLPTLFGVSY